jgi:hypothetical protein
LTLVRANEGRIVASIFNSLISLSFLGLLPWVSPGVRDSLTSRLLPRWGGAASSR